ncbi:MAG: protein translocase subunit SecD [Calditrichae bacterium]|nr:protein translocase subunit SecD [Calditrichota bacterium]MCB9057186.1 protein translocase subunit SecD [Calditrichia bacterium]
MKSNMTMRIVFIFAAIILSVYLLYPTVKLSMMSEDEEQELQMQNPDELIDLKSKAVTLGLDLQGGMHVVLEVDIRELMNKLAKNKNPEFVEALKDATDIVNRTDEDFITIFQEELAKRNMLLERYYSSAERRTEADVVAYLRKQTEEAVDRSLEILRNRIDQFGVTEPTIQKQGGRRIILELAGVNDPGRVRKIVGQTALLEFKLLKDDVTTNQVADKINKYIQARISPKDTTEEKSVDSDTSSSTALEELFGVQDKDKPATAGDSSAVASSEESPFEENLFFKAPNDNTILVPADKEEKFKDIIELPDIKKIIAEEAGSAEFLWGSKKEANDQYIPVYLVNKKQELSGETIIDTSPQAGSPNDPANVGKFEVSLTLNDDGAKTFARVTGANINKRLAIILDNRVYLAPTLQTKIANGRARITGIDTFDDARDLSIVLKAGALPAPVSIIEERTVGPSLGMDSIIAGSYSAMLGLILVMIFMILYYHFSGLVADLALVLNIVFIMAIMASLGATLTLPGIAGIILTIGMAVDANVLIFERIREEIDRGKTVRASLDQGYGKAFSTILDANVTTFIAGLVLYTYGSGPIKGFAVTLMIGIVASMFTAIIITRVIFNLYMERRTVKKLSI